MDSVKAMETAKSISNIQTQVSPIVREAQGTTIHTRPEMETAKSLVKSIKDLRKKIKETFGPIIDKAFKAHKEAKAQEKKHVQPLDDAETILRAKIDTFLDEEERKAQKAADEKAEIERTAKAALLRRAEKKIDGIMDQTLEKQKQLELLKFALDAENTTDEEAVIIQARIEVLEQQIATGQEKVADVKAKVETPVYTPPIAEPIEKSDGMSSSKVKIPTVTNAKALMKAVVDGSAPEAIVDWQMAKIKKIVNAGITLPGVSVGTKRDTRIRS